MKFFIEDTLRFLNKLTLRKALNAIQVVFSFYWSRITRNPKQSGNPYSISFEPTTACNLRCPECPSGLRSFTRSTGNLKMDFFVETIESIHKDLIYLIFYFQGEPYINPEFLDMVEYANRKKIYTITSTNGHFLNDVNAEKTVRSGLDRLIISIDGTTQETYEQYRKEGTLANVLKGTENIIKWKKKLGVSHPHVIFQFLVVGPNEHQIPELYELAREYEVDEVKLKTAQIYDYENGNPLIPENDKYSRYRKQNDGKYTIKNKLLNHCWKLWHSCVITWDGKVVPCCFDKDATHIMGDLAEDTFKQIWYGEKYVQFRRKLFRGRKEIDICKNCTEGTKVWAE